METHYYSTRQFYLYTHNSLETLAAEYRARRHSALSAFRVQDPFVPERVAVATRGMATWLEHDMVLHGDVVANMEFPFMRGMLDEILSAFRAPDADYRPELFQKELMTWRIYGILQHPGKELEVLGNYTGGNPLKALQLARKLAQLYYDYMAYLPEILEDPALADDWQLILWHKLCNNGTLLSPARQMLDFVRLDHDCLLARLHAWENANGPFAPVTFFGISAMPPKFLDVLLKLSEVVPVHFFYLNPSLEDWSTQDKRARIGTENEQLDNTLLALDGLQGREFFKAVLDAGDRIDATLDWYSLKNAGDPPSAKPGLLAAIQNCVLNCTDLLPEPHDNLAASDTLTFHGCFNDTRQIEVLHDCLLKLLDSHRGTYSLNDLIVMAPDIARFEPAIRAVFDNGPLRNSYAITDKTLRKANLLAEGFLKILRLHRTHFECSKVASLLDILPLRRRLGLEQEDVTSIRNLLQDAAIRWGQNHASTDFFSGDQRGFQDFSWENGLDRILLNFAIELDDPKSPTATFDGLSPLPFAQSSENIRTIAALSQLYSLLKDDSAQIQAFEDGADIQDWHALLQKILLDFFLEDPDTANDYQALSRAIDSFRDNYIQSGETAPLPFPVVLDALSGALETDASGGSFLNGKITFCSLMPMRSVPCKVIALIGMEEGQYPRQQERLSFNLIADTARVRDLPAYARSRIWEDRYAFLEAVLAARDYLLVFYNSRDDKKGTELPPASVVTELRAYADRLLAPAKAPFREHRLNASDPENFAEGEETPAQHPLLTRPFSFDQDAFLIGLPEADKFAGNTSFLTRLGQDAFSLPPVSNAKLQPDGLGYLNISLEDLAKYFSHPTGVYLEQRLGFPRREWERPPQSDYEPTAIDKLTASRLKRNVLGPMQSHTLLGEQPYSHDDRKLQTAYQAQVAAGTLPVGLAGQVAFQLLQLASLPKADAKPNLLSFFQEWKQASRPCTYDLLLEGIPASLPVTQASFLAKALGIPSCQLYWSPEHCPAKVRLHADFTYYPGEEAPGIRAAFFTEEKGHLLIPCFLQHLFLQAMESRGIVSRIHWDNKNPKRLSGMTPAIATNTLCVLILIYLLGHQYPLPLVENSYKITIKDGKFQNLDAAIAEDASLQRIYNTENSPAFSHEWKEAFAAMTTFCFNTCTYKAER